MVLYIKNMVCNRCKTAVLHLLNEAGVQPLHIALGEVTVADSLLTDDVLHTISQSLLLAGFELIDNRKSRIIEKIKNLVIELVHRTDEQPREKYSELIAANLHYEYSYLSKLFSEVEGVTIEHFIISQKAERIKEYLVYDEFSLSEVAFRMGYSSVAHLSAQFKKATGLTPSHFKRIGAQLRKPLDEAGKA